MIASSVIAEPGTWQVSIGGLLARTEPYVSGTACPSAGLCLAVDSEGDIDSSQDPSDAASWSSTRVTHEGISSISCASMTFCAVAAGDQMLTSTDPTDGRMAWSMSPVAEEQLQQTNRGLPEKGHLGVGTFISCPTSRLCVGVRGDEIITGMPTRMRARRPALHRRR
jgi:hypothetical protein